MTTSTPFPNQLDPAAPPVTVGAGILLGSGPEGWQPSALLFAHPVVLLRYTGGKTRLFSVGNDQPFFESDANPLDVLRDAMTAIRKHLPKPGPINPKPSFPVALVAATYEFGRAFVPHVHAFPHADRLNVDEFFASIHLDAWRPHGRGGQERVGYAGVIPAGWMEGGPTLVNTPPGVHDSPPIVPHGHNEDGQSLPLKEDSPQENHAHSVRRIQDYLRAGDTYQINFTTTFLGSTRASGDQIFDAAIFRGGAAYAGLMILPQGTLLSFSPELFMRRRGDDVETKPIKGTLRIDANGVEAGRAAIIVSTKDRAEHVMIVDLERNDLGRLCWPGSVTVAPFMDVVEHGTLLHLESTVTGRLLPKTSMRDLFAATFPGGSVTGAPKKRALEIIGELESGPRGIYCGAFGWIDVEEDCELNLPIRTALILPDGTVEFHSGGGVVADSAAEKEWQELLHKAEFMQQVLKDVERPA